MRGTATGVRRWHALPARCAAALCLLCLVAARGAAQQVAPFPRLLATTTDPRVLCATEEPLVAPDVRVVAASPAASDSASRLAESAAVAILAGELEHASTQLREATRLDPASAELAYRLARNADDMGDATTAASAYCHLRLIGTDSGQRADAAARVQELWVERGLLPPEAALVRFQRGISDAAAGALASSEQAFDDALTRAPAFSTAYYDRALVRLARGDAAGADEDLRRLAALSPSSVGPELREVRARLQRGARSPLAALGAGLVPGGAQLYTGRPVLGAVVAAATAAGIVLALREETRMEERSFVDPLGHPYTDLVPVRVRPQRTLGLAIAGSALAGGMLEGTFRVSADRATLRELARRVRSALREPALEPTAAGNGG